MGWDKLETFLDDLLVRLRSVPGAVPRLVESWRYGKSGEDQEGIDHLGRYDDGTTGTWQCKETSKLTVADVKAIVAATEVPADKHVIVFSGVGSATARKEALEHEGWGIWDQRDLANLVRTLPVHEARTLLDAHFGSSFRRGFLPVAGTDVFLGLEEFYGPLLRPGLRFHHTAELVGRDGDVSVIVGGLTSTDGPRVFVVAGPAGRGKSRLVLEALRRVQDGLPMVPVLVRAEQRLLDSGALQELPDGPSIILVEDAHGDVPGVAAVLQYARRTADVRVVLTAQPSGADPIVAAVLGAQFDLSEVAKRTIAPLTLTGARQLVTALRGDDVSLPGMFAEALARAAREVPLVAVVAIDMIRRRELSATLAVDAKFRQEILARYGDVLVAGVRGVPADTARAVLALIAVLSPVDLDDADLRERMAQFLGVPPGDLLGLVGELVNHGVVLRRGRAVRVVPDVLADEILARRAVVLDIDTGYVEQVWRAFAPTRAVFLLRNLGELDWRLRTQAAVDGSVVPDVLGRVWTQVADEVVAADSAGRSRALAELADLGGSQSARVLALVQQILDAPAPPGAISGLWNYEVTHADVRRHAAPLLRSCATANPDLLRPVLDRLWRLAQVDGRPPNQDGDHPVRIIEDLGNLGRPGSLRAATTIIGAVSDWLSEPRQSGAVRSDPLFALEALLEKEGLTQDWLPNAVSLSPHLVSPAKVADLREEVRGILLPLGTGTDVGLAVAATSLLGAALREPHGYFARGIPEQTVLGWEADDLATVRALAEIAESTTEPLVRLTVRDAVDWHAGFAKSEQVRSSCLALIDDLDNRLDDVLTDLLVGSYNLTVGPRGRRRSFADEPDAGQPGDADGAAEKGEEDLLDEDFEALELRRDRERRFVAEQLWDLGTPTQLIEALIERVTTIRTGTGQHANGLEPLLGAVAEAHPDRINGLIDAIRGGPPGVLDSSVAVLLNRLATHDAGAFTAVLTELIQERTSLATGALRGFVVRRWVSMVPASGDVVANALEHPNEEVKAQAVAGAGELLQVNLARYAPKLAAAAADYPDAVRAALNIASARRPADWLASLTADDRAAILTIVTALQDWDWSMQQLVTALAAHMPGRIIHILNDRATDRPRHLPHDVAGLATAVSDYPDELVAWIRNTARSDPASWWWYWQVWPLIAGQALTTGAAEAARRISATGVAHELDFLTGALATCDGFALQHVDLMTGLVGALQTVDSDTRELGLAQLRASARPQAFWSGSGQPAIVLAERRDAARALGEQADLGPAIQGAYRSIAEWLQELIDQALRDSAAEAEE